MEFGHLLDYNQYITGLWKSQVFLGEIWWKKTARVRHGKNNSNNWGEHPSIISITDDGEVVNAWQKKTSPRGAHRKGYGQ